MPRKGSIPLDELKKKVLRVATKTPKTGAELAQRVNVAANTDFTARGIGRALGQLVQDGKLDKHDERTPLYSKPS